MFNLDINFVYFLVDFIVLFVIAGKVVSKINKGLVKEAKNIFKKKEKVLIEAEIVEYREDVSFNNNSHSFITYYPIFEMELNGEKHRAETKLAWTPRDYHDIPVGSVVYLYINPDCLSDFSIIGVVGRTSERTIKHAINRINSSKDMNEVMFFPFFGIVLGLIIFLLCFFTVLSFANHFGLL